MVRMRAVITAPAVVCLLAAGTAHAQSFEGVVKFKMGMGKDLGEMTQMYKGTKARTEFTSGKGQAGAMIMDMGAQSMIVLMPQQKMYMVMDMNKMAAMAKNMPGAKGQGAAAAAGTPPPITDTGKTDTVAGYTCQYYIVGDTQQTEVCAAKGLGTFGMGQSPMGRMGGSPLAVLSDPRYAKIWKDGFFPLKVRSLDRNETILEATQVEKKTLDASLFVPPADYKEMKMPAFGQKP
jgi:hypothetical protein